MGGEETVPVNIFLASAGPAIDLVNVSYVLTTRRAQSGAFQTAPPAILQTTLGRRKGSLRGEVAGPRPHSW